MPELELYGTASCPFTREMRESLELRGLEFVEFDVEADSAALRRLQAIARPPLTVPILVKNGTIVQMGWEGRSCVVQSKMAQNSR
jgi:mycoredoxin